MTFNSNKSSQKGSLQKTTHAKTSLIKGSAMSGFDQNLSPSMLSNYPKRPKPLDRSQSPAINAAMRDARRVKSTLTSSAIMTENGQPIVLQHSPLIFTQAYISSVNNTKQHD